MYVYIDYIYEVLYLVQWNLILIKNKTEHSIIKNNYNQLTEFVFL